MNLRLRGTLLGVFIGIGIYALIVFSCMLVTGCTMIEVRTANPHQVVRIFAWGPFHPGMDDRQYERFCTKLDAADAELDRAFNSQRVRDIDRAMDRANTALYGTP